MKTLFTILTIPFLGLTFLSLAHAEEKGSGPDFESNKQVMIQHMDARIQNLTQAKACMNSAKNREEMKKCHESLRDEQKGMRVQMLERRKQHLDEKIQKAKSEKD